jgi:hypothetical protein
MSDKRKLKSRTVEELCRKSNEVINCLSDCNIADTFNILYNLLESFKDICKSENIQVSISESLDLKKGEMKNE